VLAASAHDPHQIVRYTRHALSTQFHPEFTPEIARSLIHYRDEVLRRRGSIPGNCWIRWRRVRSRREY
jgi:GMP synthase (glutamine-hydrolysing)